MAKECFCGCGREVPVGRKRVANVLGQQLSEIIALFEGSLERTPDPAHDDDLRRLVVTGIPLRDKVRGVVHGTLDRRDYPKDESRRWTSDALDHRERMMDELIDADFAGWNVSEQSKLLRTGAAAPATVVRVRDTRVTVNEQPRVEITLRVEPPVEEPFELHRKLLVSRVNFPRSGERVTVFYDPDDTSRFTFRIGHLTDDAAAGPAAAPPAPDRVDQIARLAELHQAGALSDAEFAQAKQRLLDDL